MPYVLTHPQITTPMETVRPSMDTGAQAASMAVTLRGQIVGENGSYRLMCLNIWLQAGGIIWEGLGGVALREEVYHWRTGFECSLFSLFLSLPPFPPLSPLSLPPLP